MQKEENPFEEEIVAQQWIISIEAEKKMIRDNDLYPFLKRWASSFDFQNIVDIGAGQGIVADKVQRNSFYIGIEPSKFLVARANELYAQKNRKFIIGNAYQLPLSEAYADAAISINVWFHLGNLVQATKELARILKPGGHFLISTANPGAYGDWLKMFENPSEKGKIIDGKVLIPVQPLERNIFFRHSLKEILDPLVEHGLVVEDMVKFGLPNEHNDGGLFITLTGRKKQDESD